MREMTLKDVFEQIALDEINEYKNAEAPEVRFSLGHKIRMRRIFKMYSRKVYGSKKRVHGLLLSATQNAKN